MLKSQKLILNVRNSYISVPQKSFCSKETTEIIPKIQAKQNKNQQQRLVKEKIISEETKEAAKKKLLSLLSEFEVDSTTSKLSNLNLAKAAKRPSKKERFKNVERKMTPEEKLKISVKEVASKISDEPEKTEYELTEKLSSIHLIESERTYDEKEVATKSHDILDEDVNKNIMSSVEDVASAVKNNTVPKHSKLTERLFRLSVEGKRASIPRKSLDELVKGMKVVAPKLVDFSKEIRKREDHSLQRQRSSQTRSRANAFPQIHIFKATPLDIFTSKVDAKSDSNLLLWEELESKRVKLTVTYAPTNAFEEMIMWTEQGKHWKFPIDNQAAMVSEENIGFHEHVFLEEHLHGFPTRGPLRHFMELVVVGLSKNPYISVERKIENINWFRDYFKEKEGILKEVGAIV